MKLFKYKVNVSVKDNPYRKIITNVKSFMGIPYSISTITKYCVFTFCLRGDSPPPYLFLNLAASHD